MVARFDPGWPIERCLRTCNNQENHDGKPEGKESPELRSPSVGICQVAPKYRRELRAAQSDEAEEGNTAASFVDLTTEPLVSFKKADYRAY